MAELAGAGLTAAQLALVMELSAAVAAEARPTVDRAAENKRAYDRKYRQEHRNNRTTSYETSEPSDGVSLDKKAPQTPEKIKPIPCVRESRARLGYHRLPEGWQPSRNPPPQLQAKLDQWPPGARQDETAAFKRWAANAEDKNGKGRKLDWDKALWNWLGRRHDEYYGKINRIGQRQPSGWEAAFHANTG